MTLDQKGQDRGRFHSIQVVSQAARSSTQPAICVKLIYSQTHHIRQFGCDVDAMSSATCSQAQGSALRKSAAFLGRRNQSRDGECLFFVSPSWMHTCAIFYPPISRPSTTDRPYLHISRS